MENHWKRGRTVRLKSFKAINNLTIVMSTVFFAADVGGELELWKSTGTSGSTVKVKEFVAGATQEGRCS